LGLSLGLLEGPCALLVLSWCSRAPLGVLLELSLGHLEYSLGVFLGISWGSLWASWKAVVLSWCSLGALGPLLGLSLAVLKALATLLVLSYCGLLGNSWGSHWASWNALVIC
jgi:hypothetical protein